MFLLYLFMGSRKVKVREVGIEPTETEALLLAMAIGVFRAAAAAARKGRPSLRSHSPELPWARSFWLPVKCARLSVGAGYSLLSIVVSLL